MRGIADLMCLRTLHLATWHGFHRDEKGSDGLSSLQPAQHMMLSMRITLMAALCLQYQALHAKHESMSHLHAANFRMKGKSPSEAFAARHGCSHALI